MTIIGGVILGNSATDDVPFLLTAAAVLSSYRDAAYGAREGVIDKGPDPL